MKRIERLYQRDLVPITKTHVDKTRQRGSGRSVASPART